MPPDDKQPSQVEVARTSLNLAFKVLAQIGLLTVAVIVGALFGGLLLDRWLETRPLFTVLLLLGSFPVTMYIIYRVALNAVGQVPPTARRTTRATEDQGSDDNSA